MRSTHFLGWFNVCTTSLLHVWTKRKVSKHVGYRVTFWKPETVTLLLFSYVRSVCAKKEVVRSLARKTIIHALPCNIARQSGLWYNKAYLIPIWLKNLSYRQIVLMVRPNQDLISGSYSNVDIMLLELHLKQSTDYDKTGVIPIGFRDLHFCTVNASCSFPSTICLSDIASHTRSVKWVHHNARPFHMH